MEKLGGRKFLVLILMLAAGGLAEHFNKNGLSTNLVYLMLGLYGAFTAGNVGITLTALKKGLPELPETVETRQDVAEAPAEEFQAKPAELVESQPTLDSDGPLMQIDNRLSSLETSMNQVVASTTPQNQSLGFLVQAEQRRQMKEITG